MNMNLRLWFRTLFSPFPVRIKSNQFYKFISMVLLAATIPMYQIVKAANNENTDMQGNPDANQNTVQSTEHPDHVLSHLDEVTIHELFHWVEGHVTDHELDINNKMPDIQHVSRKALFKVAFRRNADVAFRQKDIQIYGLYNFKNETIYLLDSIDEETERGKAILLHELVHYLQYQNHIEQGVKCMHQLERLAYNLEAEHLKEHDTVPDFSSDSVRRASKCNKLL